MNNGGSSCRKNSVSGKIPIRPAKSNFKTVEKLESVALVVNDEFKSQPCKTNHYTYGGEILEGLRCCELLQTTLSSTAGLAILMMDTIICDSSTDLGA
eukprot:scaffold24597_cov62-Cyclotella_meneghiniana.AAC.3